MFRRKWIIVVIVLLLIGGGASAFFARRGDTGVLVTAETIQKRDLEAIVSASGKIDPKKTVNISAQSMGRVTQLAVREGDRVKEGHFLLQIDPVNAEAAVRRDEASVAGARTGLEQSRASLQAARASLESARQSLKRQQELSAAGLTTRESLERAQTEVEVRESDLKAREQEIKSRETQLNQQQAGLQSSRHTLTQVRFEAPFDGIVTRRNIEEGENVMVGTMNNAGTVLLTVADMSVIEAEVEVDETDIPNVKLGQTAKITIDAMSGKTFTGKVTEIGNSPIQAAGGAASQATNFKVKVTLEGEVPDVRPGFTCTAEITTATRAAVIAVPIQATTVREKIVDRDGNMVQEANPGPGKRRPTTVQDSELKPGQEKKELEGVFVVKDNKAVFVPMKTGIAGEKYFEVLSGAKEGDQVIVGPFSSVRELAEGAAVKVEAASRSTAAKK